LALFHAERFEAGFGLVVVDGVHREGAGLAVDDMGADAVAGLGFVRDRAGDGDRAIVGGGPAADDGVVERVAGVAAVGGQLQPPELAVGPGGGALPGLAGEVGERGEGFDFAGGGVDRAVAVLPGTFRDLGWRGVWGDFRRDEEVSGGDDFVVGGVALVEELVEVADPGIVVGEGRDVGAVQERAGAFDDERGVHEEEGLLWDGRGVALGGVEVGVGEVEGAEEAGEVLAVNEAVDRAAFGKGLFEHVGGTAAGGFVEFSCYGEQGITHCFEIEARRCHSREQAVLRIARVPRAKC
jgi:hypothetical protein